MDDNLLHVIAERESSQEYYRELVSLDEKNMPSKVTFPHEAPREELAALINEAEVCVHPSQEEAVSLAVVEEMSLRKANDRI